MKRVKSKVKVKTEKKIKASSQPSLSQSSQSTLDTRFQRIIQTQQRVAPEIIHEIVSDALSFSASDIHFEPQEHEVVVRFRVDGLLQEAGRIPRQYYDSVINRVKVQAHLRIDEHFSAQDGAIRHTEDDTVVDLRVSITPTLDGEKIVMRVLSEYVRGFTLTDLGLSKEYEEVLLHIGQKPFGMILVAGPTGSGKTTTLYALLKVLNKPEINVTTIEDPVEYKIVGVNQIQVNPQTNLTFSKGLRSIVRQDPDIILVGEIRDHETAEIAVNAALTGHLLLSTFHATDAATAIPRLLEMKVEPFLLASTLELIIAQRLVRKICDHCKVSKRMSAQEYKKFPQAVLTHISKKPSTLFYGKGCKECNGYGYSGRVALFELIVMTDEMQELMLTNPSAKHIRELARKQGAHSLFEDGMKKVCEGVTTLEEVVRVAMP